MIKTIDLNELEQKDFVQIDKIKIQLSKVFDRNNINNKFNIKEDEISSNQFILDKYSIIGIAPKTNLGFEILKEFYNEDYNLNRQPPELDYISNEEETKCNYNLTLLNKIMMIIKAFDGLITTNKEVIKMGVRSNYPLIMENDHIKIILAPRGEI